jgi:hypothetical protein
VTANTKPTDTARGGTPFKARIGYLSHSPVME